MATPSVYVDPELHKGQADLSTMSLTNVVPNNENNVNGWYKTGNSTYNIGYIEDNNLTLRLTVWSSSFAAGKPHELDPNNAYAVFTFYRFNSVSAGSVYILDSPTLGGGPSYQYSTRQQALLPVTIGGVGNNTSIYLTIFDNIYPIALYKIVAPDGRMWNYNLEITDYSAQFFDFNNVAEYAKHDLTAGRMSGFDIPGRHPAAPMNFGNALDANYSQVGRSSGSSTRRQFDELFNALNTTGVIHSYGVKKLVYWPRIVDGIPLSTSSQFQGYILQNRYGFMTFYPIIPNEGPDNYGLLIAGERVTVSGTGTRLDDKQLRLLAQAGRSGTTCNMSKQGVDFINDAFSANWTYYTLRLPLLVTNANNAIKYRRAGAAVDDTLLLPLGQYYFTELQDYINQQLSFVYVELFDQATPWESNPPFPQNQNFRAPPSLYFHAEVGSVWYGPDDGSTFFGLLGLELNEFFVGPSLTAGADRIVFIAAWDEFKVYTPLTNDELLTLQANLGNMNVSAQHGPFASCPYDSYVAAIGELQNASSREVHAAVSGWSRPGGDGTDEYFLTREEVVAVLKEAELTYDYIYGVNNTVVPPGLRQVTSGISAFYLTYAERYSPGTYNLTVPTNQGSLYKFTPDIMYYGPNAIANFTSGAVNLSGRQYEVIAVNYLADPRWMISFAGPDNEPVIDTIPYIQYESYYSSNPNRPIVNNIIPSEFLLGVVREDKVREALSLAPGDIAPIYGYLRYTESSISLNGNSGSQPWYEQYAGFARRAPTKIADAITQYMNNNNVQHVFVDVLNTQGGTSSVFEALAEHMGADRVFNKTILSAGNIAYYDKFDDNGNSRIDDTANVRRRAENMGLIPYNYTSFANYCSPSLIASPDIFGPNTVFGGTKTGLNPNLNSERVVLWTATESTTSATQDAYLTMKGSSLDPEYAGDFGNNVRFVGYGSYPRPFSTGGGYEAFYNTYGKGRAGEEELRVPVLPFVSRFEGFRTKYYDRENVCKSTDQDFGNLQRPSIKWDMNPDVFFEDIGYTQGAGVDETLYGRPWIMAPRYPGVVYTDQLTWRCTLFEHSLRMMADPTLNTHIYANDGFGNVSAP